MSTGFFKVENGLRPDTYTEGIHVFFGGLAGLFLLMIMMITVVDVIGRYVFSAPLPGGFEITQFLMAALIYAGLPSACRQESHVTIDLLDPITPRPLIRPRQILINIVAAIVLGVISWQLWIFAGRIADYGDVTEYLQMPRAPIIYYMSVLSGVGSVMFLSNVARYVRGHSTPASSPI